MGLFTLQRFSPFADDHQRLAAGRFGMVLFLLSLAMLFAATIIGYLVIRLAPNTAVEWPPPGARPLPVVLWLNTVVLLASSATFVAAMRCIRRDERVGFRRWIDVTFALGILFLVLQVLCWATLLRDRFVMTEGLYAWSFYVFTGLHAVHVIGGLVPLAVICWRARRGAYDRDHHAGPIFTAMYWHFLDVVWLVLMVVLWSSG